MPKLRLALVGIVILVVGVAQSLLNGQSGGQASTAFNIEAAARSRAIQTECNGSMPIVRRGSTPS